MTELPQDDTRRRLIVAAGEIFAEHGFKAATVRDICGRAEANVAAVNYYFGDKFGLYIEAVQAAHCGGDEIIHQNWPAGMRPEEKLRIFIRQWLEHFLDEQSPSWHTRLMLREMADPTEACAKLVESYIRPMSNLLRDIIQELVPATISEEQRWLIGFSIVGQCLFYKVHRPVAELLLGTQRHGLLNLDLLADHIARFSLAALGGDEPIVSDSPFVARSLVNPPQPSPATAPPADAPGGLP
jgi:AcrR family transcriptional regulator